MNIDKRNKSNNFLSELNKLNIYVKESKIPLAVLSNGLCYFYKLSNTFHRVKLWIVKDGEVCGQELSRTEGAGR